MDTAKVLGQDYLPNDHYAVFRTLTRFARVDRTAVLAALGISELDYGSGRARLCSAEDFRQLVAPLIRDNHDDFCIPQGSPISALASNLSMLDFDARLTKAVSAIGGIYRRYSDDILAVCDPDRAPKIESAVKHALSDIGLVLKDSKTVRSHFSLKGNALQVVDGGAFPYLGFTFDGQQRLVRSSSLSRHWRRLKSKVRITAKAARRADEENPELFRRDIYERFSHLGNKPNFVHYAYRASTTMRSKAIRRQVRRHMEIIDQSVRKAEESTK